MKTTSDRSDRSLNWQVISSKPQQLESLTIEYGWHKTPFGKLLLGVTQHGICLLSFNTYCTQPLEEARKRWPNAVFRENTQGTQSYADLLEKQKNQLPLHIIGTEFQTSVWQALLSIPEGEVRSYSQIATEAGKPKAVRATGTAIGQNPIGWLIPCHRVVPKNGGVGNYHCGPELKAAILHSEGVDPFGL